LTQFEERPHSRQLREGFQANEGGHWESGLRDLLHLFVSKLRMWALKLICLHVRYVSECRFKPSVSLEYLTDVLAFSGSEECREFLKQIACVIDESKDHLNLKESKRIICESKLLQGGFD
jgi:hypothetical protein